MPTEFALHQYPSAPPVAKLDRSVFIAWKTDCYRSRATAATFGCPIVLLGSGKGKLRTYLRLMRRTWATLQEMRPRTVLCLNQPPMLPLLCWWWAKRNQAVVIQDFHSGALTHKYWRPFLGAYKAMVRMAPFTIAHNRIDAERLRQWGGAVSVMLTLPGDPTASGLPEVRASSDGSRPSFLFVCTFADDEPIPEVLEAFARSPEFDVLVTGDFRKAGLDPARQPDNVKLLGFVEYREYLQYMAAATAVITLSRRDHIMQMAVEEAITLGVPVLTNHSPTLQEALGDAGHHVDISPGSIASGLRALVSRRRLMAEAAAVTRHRRWAAIEQELRALRQRHAALFEDSPVRG